MLPVEVARQEHALYGAAHHYDSHHDEAEADVEWRAEVDSRTDGPRVDAACYSWRHCSTA